MLYLLIYERVEVLFPKYPRYSFYYYIYKDISYDLNVITIVFYD